MLADLKRPRTAARLRRRGCSSTLEPGASRAAARTPEAGPRPPRRDAGRRRPPASAAGPARRRPPSTPQVERLRGLGYVQAVLWLAARLADGLAHAHERGILHRDLKPANVLFADDGQPMLLDFNLAADTKLRVRASAALVGGTLPYMAPEHLDGLPRRARPPVDARSDLYSLGVILFELLTGRHPFPIRRARSDEILPPDDRRPARAAPRRCAAGTRRSRRPSSRSSRRCLEPDPARRYQSARELQEDLQRSSTTGR